MENRLRVTNIIEKVDILRNELVMLGSTLNIGSEQRSNISMAEMELEDSKNFLNDFLNN